MSDASQPSPPGPTLEAGSLEPRRRRRDADGHQQRVGLDARAVAQTASHAREAVWHRSPRLSSVVASRRSTPWSRCMDLEDTAHGGPTARSSGTERGSTTTTSAPRPRAVAATSRPMKPAPAMTSRAPGLAMTARSGDGVIEVAQASARPAGPVMPASGRGVAPVAITRPSKAKARPSARTTDRAAMSRCAAADPR